MFARTDRLLLRPGWVEDAPALHKAISDEAIVCNLASAPWPYRYEDALTFLSRDRNPREPACLIYLRTAGAPKLIGSIGLGPCGPGEVELGYWIARRHWGRGFATEAGQAIVANARDTLRLTRLHAGHFLDNPASGRVLAKLGFRPTGEISARYSSGRKVESPCRLFTLELNEPDEAAAPAAIAA